jgi:DNA invertase Pin-like site-specific DNA recombinase
MRVAIYARVSSEEQVEGYSLDAQLRACRRYVADHGWTVFREYIEEGRSARTDDVNKRPQFKQMMEDAQQRHIDTVLVHKLDRFARNRRIAFDCFDHLTKWNIGFVSLLENMDFSTPWGGLALTMLVGLAQFYSDNLSLETKKGWAERKAQGLYCSLLPFGVGKGTDGLPEPDPDTFDGLAMAFEAAAQGKSDREIAIALNAAGLRITGNRGTNLFTKDSVRGLLTNRFYVSELPDGRGGWLKAKHAPLIDDALFKQAQAARRRNRRSPRTIATTARVSSLSGLLRCAACEGPLWMHQNERGRTRAYCRNRARGSGCQNRGTFMETYEQQVMEYLREFSIPDDYQRKLLDLYADVQRLESDDESKRRELAARLERLKKLYTWGDLAEADYLAQRRQITAELDRLEPSTSNGAPVEKLAEFLRNVATAWEEASQELRNRLGRQLFEAVWVRNDKVVAVRPRPELRMFFRMNLECHAGSMSGDPDGIRATSFPIRFTRSAPRHLSEHNTRSRLLSGKNWRIFQRTTACANLLGTLAHRTRPYDVRFNQP